MTPEELRKLGVTIPAVGSGTYTINGQKLVFPSIGQIVIPYTARNWTFSKVWNLSVMSVFNSSPYKV